MTAEEKKVIDAIKAQMDEAECESVSMEIEGLEVLRVLMDQLGESGSGDAIIEFCFLPIGDEAEEMPDDLRLFQIFTTIAAEIPKEKYPAVLSSLNKLNEECLLGGYGLFEQEGQMYHKMVSVVRGDTAEKMLEIIQPAINWIGATVVDNYDELVSLCN